MPIKAAQVQEKIAQLEERKQAATDSGIEDEAKLLQEDIDFQNEILKTIQDDEKAEKEAQEAQEAEETAKNEEEGNEEPKKEEYNFSKEEMAEQIREEVRKQNEIADLAVKRNTNPTIIKAALSVKPEDFEGTLEEYLDSVGLKQNKPFDDSVQTDPVKEAMGGREPFTKEEIADPNFYTKNQDILEKLYEVDPVAHGNLLADHYESEGNLADGMDDYYGWNTGKNPVK